MICHLKIYFFILLKCLLKSHNFDTRLLEMAYFEKSVTTGTPTYMYIYIYIYIYMYTYQSVPAETEVSKYAISSNHASKLCDLKRHFNNIKKYILR